MRDLKIMSVENLGTLASSIIERRAMGYVTDFDGTPLKLMYDEIYAEIQNREIEALSVDG